MNVTTEGIENIQDVVTPLLLTEEEKEQITADNFTKLIYFVANKFANTGIDIDELASVASVGFVKALNAYDKSRNIRFSTFSVNCMRNEILYFLRKERRHVQNNISLSFTLSTDGSGNNFNMEDILSTSLKETTNTEDKIEQNEDFALLHKALTHLSNNEKYIAIYRFGLNRGIRKTQREIAEDIGMSQANVSKIEKGLLVKLKDVLFDDYNMLWRDSDLLQEEEEEDAL